MILPNGVNGSDTIAFLIHNGVIDVFSEIGRFRGIYGFSGSLAGKTSGDSPDHCARRGAGWSGDSPDACARCSSGGRTDTRADRVCSGFTVEWIAIGVLFIMRFAFGFLIFFHSSSLVHDVVALAGKAIRTLKSRHRGTVSQTIATIKVIDSVFFALFGAQCSRQASGGRSGLA
ncbi:MAG: hypothetical protein AB1813_22255 [Verrucomicrobiota bacterium]